jgi:hypothetical protein
MVHPTSYTERGFALGGASSIEAPQPNVDFHLAAPPSRRTRFKDSCDMCAAAKIRCTKEKPNCTRCVKYGHQCSYSPARRMGRPWRGSMAGSSCLPAEIAMPGPPVVPVEDVELLGEPPSLWRQDNTSNLEVSITEDFFGICAAGTDTVPPGQSVEARETHGKSTDHRSCESVIMDILMSLNPCDANDPFAKIISAITIAVKSLSRVLVCPCSQSLDIVLLATAVCNAVLDRLSDLVGVTAPRGNVCTLKGIASTDIPINRAERMQSGTAARRVDISVTITELHQVANLIMQFTRRYSGSNISTDLKEIFPGLAGGLRSRLQDIMAEMIRTEPVQSMNGSQRPV